MSRLIALFVWCLVFVACRDKTGMSRPDAEKSATEEGIAVALDTMAPTIGAVDVSEMAGDTSTYLIGYALSKPPRVADTVQVRLGRDSLSPASRGFITTAKRTTQQGNASLKIPKIFGTQARMYACIRLYAKTVLVAGSEKCAPKWTTNVPAKPDTTPPTIDSVTVDSTLAYVRAIRTTSNPMPIQYCLFHKLKDGKLRLAANQLSTKGCLDLYKLFPLALQLPKPRGVLFTDAYWNVIIDVTRPTDNTVTLELIRRTVVPGRVRDAKVDINVHPVTLTTR